MEKDLFIEQFVEKLDGLIEDTEDRDDRADFQSIIDSLAEVREDLYELVEN